MGGGAPPARCDRGRCRGCGCAERVLVRAEFLAPRCVRAQRCPHSARPAASDGGAAEPRDDLRPRATARGRHPGSGIRGDAQPRRGGRAAACRQPHLGTGHTGGTRAHLEDRRDPPRPPSHVHALRAPARAGRVILPLLRLMAWRVVLPWPARSPTSRCSLTRAAARSSGCATSSRMRPAPRSSSTRTPWSSKASRTGLADDGNARLPCAGAAVSAAWTLQDLDGERVPGRPVGERPHPAGVSVPPGRNFGAVTRSDSCSCFDAGNGVLPRRAGCLALPAEDPRLRRTSSTGPFPSTLHATQEDNSFYSPSDRRPQLRRRRRGRRTGRGRHLARVRPRDPGQRGPRDSA